MGSTGLSYASLHSVSIERESVCAWVSGIVDVLWLCTHLTTYTKPPFWHEYGQCCCHVMVVKTAIEVSVQLYCK